MRRPSSRLHRSPRTARPAEPRSCSTPCPPQGTRRSGRTARWSSARASFGAPDPVRKVKPTWRPVKTTPLTAPLDVVDRRRDAGRRALADRRCLELCRQSGIPALRRHGTLQRRRSARPCRAPPCGCPGRPPWPSSALYLASVSGPIADGRTSTVVRDGTRSRNAIVARRQRPGRRAVVALCDRRSRLPDGASPEPGLVRPPQGRDRRPAPAPTETRRRVRPDAAAIRRHVGERLDPLATTLEQPDLSWVTRAGFNVAWSEYHAVDER